MFPEVVIKELIACNNFGVNPHAITKLIKQDEASDGMLCTSADSSIR